MDIRTFKLSSGEEIIGKVKHEDSDTFIIEDVLLIVGQNTPQGMQVGLMPFMFSNPEGAITIRRPHIMVEGKVSGDLEKGYIERTSKIAMATSI